MLGDKNISRNVTSVFDMSIVHIRISFWIEFIFITYITAVVQHPHFQTDIYAKVVHLENHLQSSGLHYKIHDHKYI